MSPRRRWAVLVGEAGAMLLGLALGEPRVFAAPIVAHALATGFQPSAPPGSTAGLSGVEGALAPARNLDEIGYPSTFSAGSRSRALPRPALPPLVLSGEPVPGLVTAASTRPWLVPAPPRRAPASARRGLTTTIPEPTSLILLTTGLLGLVARRKLLGTRTRGVGRG